MRKRLLMMSGLLVAFFFISFTVSAQHDPYEIIVSKIDSLADLGLPKSALTEVDKLDKLARKNKDGAQQIRATVYRITFISYLEENALVAVINQLKSDISQAEFPVKPVLQSVLADTYWKYYRQNRYQFSQRSKLEKPDASFTNWDLSTIIHEVSNLYRLSVQDENRAQNTPVAILKTVLTGDSATRYLRPTLYDLLVHRALEFYLDEEPDLLKPKLPFSLNKPDFFSDSQTFASLNIITNDTTSTAYQGIKLLQEATTYHLTKNNAEPLADLDFKRLEFLNRKSTLQSKDSLYLEALQKIAGRTADYPISAEAFYKIGQFYQNKDSLNTAVEYFTKATKAYPESYSAINAGKVIETIELKELNVSLEAFVPAGKPILTLIQYKNLHQISATVYPVNEKELKLFFDYKNQTDNDSKNDSKVGGHKALAYIEGMKPVFHQEIALPDPEDYRFHGTEFKIDALPLGQYVVVFKDLILTDSSGIEFGNFQVTNLSYVSRLVGDQMEVLAMDRETGEPINGATVELSIPAGDEKDRTKTKLITKGKTSVNGKVSLTFAEVKVRPVITLEYNGDRFVNTSNDTYYPRNISADNSVREERTMLFTDRNMYRPGQTIYFKGLQIESVNRKSSLLTGKDIEVKLIDDNDKDISKLQLKTNDFGSFSGSFIIPQNVLNGDMDIETDFGSVAVKVEEYKRPTFEVNFDPVKETYRLGDSVHIKGMVKSYAGYGISNARVAIHITKYASTNHPLYSRIYRNPESEVLSDTVFTKDNGEFTLTFKSVNDNPLDPELLNYFQVSGAAIDAGGETHKANTHFTIGNTALRINANLPETYIYTDSPKVFINIANLNNQVQKGKIEVEVFSLTGDGKIYKSRMWEKPDLYLMSKTAFDRDFPALAYQKEDDFKSWSESKIHAFNIDFLAEKDGFFDFDFFKKLATGMYKIRFKATSAQGDTVSATRYVNYIDEKATPPTLMKDWMVPVKTAGNASESAEFIIGTGKPDQVLMEIYSGAKLLSAEWIKTQSGREKRKVAFSLAENLKARFLRIRGNRVYKQEYDLRLAEADKNLNLKFLTFRNKLQPGEKEQWKLQITNGKNEKQAAEMLASLYDVSLDALAGRANWSTFYPGFHPVYPLNWAEGNFNNAIAQSVPFWNRYASNTFFLTDYERLDLFGYHYYGGYNQGYRQYLKRVAERKAAVKPSPALIAQIKKNIAALKGDFMVSGNVLDHQTREALPNVIIFIHGKAIGITGSQGSFFLKVPSKSELMFSVIGYDDLKIKLGERSKLQVSMKENRHALQEVVIRGYQKRTKEATTGSSYIVSGNNNAPVANVEQLLQGKVAGLNTQNNTGTPGFRGAVNIRGLNSLQEVVVTQGSSENEEGLPGAPVTIRKNFNETAFFYPHLKTDEQGEILIDFTVPESLTRWRFRGLAHTKDLQFGRIESEILTQKLVMVTANMPRFFRESDTLTVSARLANLTDKALKTTVKFKLYNALTMQPVAMLADVDKALQTINVEANATGTVSFKLIIPDTLDAVTYQITAEAGRFSDGEENTIPVLPNAMLVAESMPMMVRAGQTRSYTMDKLVEPNSTTLKNKSLTLEFTDNPIWYAVQALPYLMEYPYECAEQTFSRYFANNMAAGIVKSMPVIKRVFDRWKAADSKELLSNLETNPELKSVLLEETPWLRDAANETEQKKRMALLFDLNRMDNELETNLKKLEKMQLPDGSFPWFAGLRSDRFITQHILAGIGQLYHLKMVDEKNATLQNIADKALGYLDREIIKEQQSRHKLIGKSKIAFRSTDDHAWYARSYFPKPLTGKLKEAWLEYLKETTTGWKLKNVYEQGMIALTMTRYKQPNLVKQIVRSLNERAKQSEELGMYWPANQGGYYWNQAPVETQAMLIELFTETENDQKATEEMKIWLLRNKQTNNWRTTKATAAACYALLLEGNATSLDLTTQQVDITLGGQPLTDLKPDLKAEAGTGYVKTNWADELIKPTYGKLEIRNPNKNISWGSLTWQYLEKLDKITPSKTNITLERKYFVKKQTDNGAILTALTPDEFPKPGDVLKVVVYVNADRDFEYIHLKDMRPSGTEPMDVLSGYKYQDGLYYYQVTKDVATNFFIDKLKKGNYVFEYELRIVQPGNFSTGITTIQSMYAPEFNAHSAGDRIWFSNEVR